MDAQVHMPITFDSDICVLSLNEFLQQEFLSGDEQASFQGNKEDYWKIVFIEKGTAVVGSNQTNYIVNQGEAAFFSPLSDYKIYPFEQMDMRFLLIGFTAASTHMTFFNNVIASLNVFEHDNLYYAVKCFYRYRGIISNAQENGETEMEVNPLIHLLMMKNHLELVLMSMYQRRIEETKGYRIHSFSKKTREKRVVIQVKKYLKGNIGKLLSVDTIAADNGYSAAQLQRIFKNECGVSVIDYFINIKIEYAKLLINEGQCTITEIALNVGYNNPNYFSRLFKKKVGLSPSEYGNL